MIASLLAFLKGLPELVKVVREVLSLFTSLFALIKESREVAKANEVEENLTKALKHAATLPKDEKQKAVKAIQDALSGNKS